MKYSIDFNFSPEAHWSKMLEKSGTKLCKGGSSSPFPRLSGHIRLWGDSCNEVDEQPKKIENQICKVLWTPRTSQNSYFQSHFSVSKIGWIFPKKISMKNIWLGDQLLEMKFIENFDF